MTDIIAVNINTLFSNIGFLVSFLFKVILSPPRFTLERNAIRLITTFSYRIKPSHKLEGEVDRKDSRVTILCCQKRNKLNLEYLEPQQEMSIFELCTVF